MLDATTAPTVQAGKKVATVVPANPMVDWCLHDACLRLRVSALELRCVVAVWLKGTSPWLLALRALLSVGWGGVRKHTGPQLFDSGWFHCVLPHTGRQVLVNASRLFSRTFLQAAVPSCTFPQAAVPSCWSLECSERHRKKRGRRT